MNENDLLTYLRTHNGLGCVGHPDTLAAARSLQAQGKVRAVGVREGNVYFRLTEYGRASSRIPIRVKVVKMAKSAGRAVQSYKTALANQEPAPYDYLLGPAPQRRHKR